MIRRYLFLPIFLVLFFILNICLVIGDSEDILPWGIARLDLENSLEQGDIQGAKDAYGKLVQYREDSVSSLGELGEKHMEYYAPKKYMDSLGKNLNAGKTKEAQNDLYYLASSCGQAICHKGSGGMGELEFAYFDIKAALADGDIENASAAFPKFKKGYYDTKDDFRRIIPAKTEEMDDTFVDNLGAALEAGDLEAAEIAREELSKDLCAFNKGCHGGLIVGGAPTIDEAFKEKYSDYSAAKEEIEKVDVDSSAINYPVDAETEEEGKGICGPTAPLVFAMGFVSLFYRLINRRVG